jgi:hypothetical protein
VQMVGRGTRCVGADINASIANGKADCLVLDFAGNVTTVGALACSREDDRVAGRAFLDRSLARALAGARRPSRRSCREGPLRSSPSRRAPSTATTSRGGSHLEDVTTVGALACSREDDRVAGRAFLDRSLARALACREGPLRSSPSRRAPSTATTSRGGSHQYESNTCARLGPVQRLADRGGERLRAAVLPPEPLEPLARLAAGELREVAEVRIRPSGKFWEVCGRKIAPLGLPWKPWRGTAPRRRAPARTARTACALGRRAPGISTPGGRPRIVASAAVAPILSRGAPSFVAVTSRTFYRHDKPGGIPHSRGTRVLPRG